MKSLKVLVLMHKLLVPPEDTSGINTQKADWKTEFDVVTTLRKIVHEVEPLGVETDLGIIRSAIDAFKPHIVFNMLEAFHNVAIFESNVVSYLELLKVPYTGCNPRGLLLAKDKGLSKKLMAYHRIPMPEFAVFRRGQKIRVPKALTFTTLGIHAEIRGVGCFRWRAGSSGSSLPGYDFIRPDRGAQRIMPIRA